MSNDTITPVDTQTSSSVAPASTGMFEDNSGGTSSMRVFMIAGGGFILALWGFIAVWQALHGIPITDVPTQWGIMFSSLIGGKVIQKYFETKTP